MCEPRSGISYGDPCVTGLLVVSVVLIVVTPEALVWLHPGAVSSGYYF